MRETVLYCMRSLPQTHARCKGAGGGRQRGRGRGRGPAAAEWQLGWRGCGNRGGVATAVEWQSVATAAALAAQRGRLVLGPPLVGVKHVRPGRISVAPAPASLLTTWAGEREGRTPASWSES